MSGNATLGTAVAEVSLDYSKLEAGINASKTKMDALKFAMADLAVVGVGAAVGIGVATVKMAGDFQEGMTSLVTGAGESQKNIGLVSDGILNLATQTGTSTKDLTAGMYMIESAGYHGAAGLDVLKAAAEGAKVGSASLADVANGVTTAMTDYAASGLTAAQATNALIATVAAGKTHMGDLANSLANILPTASAAGVGLRDVMGAMATMTGEGIPAAQAATYLRQTILGLIAPSAGTVKALDAVGLKSADVAVEMKKSLPDALAMITDAVGKKFPEGSAEYVNAIKNISGGSKTMQGMLDLTGDHLKTFEGNVKTISGTVKSGGGAIQGWALVQEDFNTKVAQAKEIVETLGIKIGTVLLPVATSLFDLVTPLVSGFDDWITKSGALSQITTDLSTVTTQLAGAFQVVTTPVTQIKQVMTPLLDDIDRASGYFKPLAQSVNTMSDAFDRGMGAVAPFVPGLNTMSDAVDRGNGAFASVVTTVNPFVDIFQQLKPVFSDVVGIFQEAGSIIPPLVKDFEDFTTGIAAAAWNSGALQSVIHAVKDILPDVGTFLQNVGTDINTNLLPPLESLVTNVGGAVSNFANWVDSSGAAKTALQDLSGFISATTQVLGPLIQGVSDVVGWLGGGGAGTDTLVFALSAVATAFLGLKIADTVSQFSNLWTKLSDGEGILANLASSFKDKLGGAVDSFLQSQAPNFKKSLDDMKVKATDAATAETTVGTEAEVASTKVTIATGTMKGEYEQLSLFADEAATAEEGVGTAAETNMAEGVASGVGKSEASMGELAATAEVSGTAVGGIGIAALGAIVPVLGLAVAMAGIAKALHDSGAVPNNLPKAPSGMRYDGNHQLVEDTAATNAKIVASYKAMQIDASSSVTLMNGTIAKSMDETKVKSYTDVSSFTSDAMTMFQKMGDYGTQQMQSLDHNTIGYWNDVAGYIASHPINAAINIDTNKGSVYSNVSSGIQKNFYAEGVTNAPPGWAIVGENGPELMHMHGGEDVLPHGKMPYSSGGGIPYTSSSSGGGGHSGPVNIYVMLDAKQIGHMTAPHIVQEMRVRTGTRS